MTCQELQCATAPAQLPPSLGMSDTLPQHLQVKAPEKKRRATRPPQAHGKENRHEHSCDGCLVISAGGSPCNCFSLREPQNVVFHKMINFDSAASLWRLVSPNQAMAQGILLIRLSDGSSNCFKPLMPTTKGSPGRHSFRSLSLSCQNSTSCSSSAH